MNFNLVLKSVIETISGPLFDPFLNVNAGTFFFLSYIFSTSDIEGIISMNISLVLESVNGGHFWGVFGTLPSLNARNVMLKKWVLSVPFDPLTK